MGDLGNANNVQSSSALDYFRRRPSTTHPNTKVVLSHNGRLLISN